MGVEPLYYVKGPAVYQRPTRTAEGALYAMGFRVCEVSDGVDPAEVCRLLNTAEKPRCWCLDDSGKSLCVQTPPINPAPETALIKELADWWATHSHKSNSRPTLAALCGLAQRAYDLVSS